MNITVERILDIMKALEEAHPSNDSMGSPAQLMGLESQKEGLRRILEDMESGHGVPRCPTCGRVMMEDRLAFLVCRFCSQQD